MWPDDVAKWLRDHAIADASYVNGAINGTSVASWRTNIDATLAGISQMFDDVLIDLGVNDGPTAGNAQWQADYSYILDAIHTKWPSAKVIVSYPWKRNWAAEAIASHAAIDSMLSSRSAFARAGDDEAVWLENGDDGATMTADGVHYSIRGDNKKATLVEAELP